MSREVAQQLNHLLGSTTTITKLQRPLTVTEIVTLVVICLARIETQTHGGYWHFNKHIVYNL